MTFALLSRSKSKPKSSEKPAPKRKSVDVQRPSDARSGFAKPAFQPQTAALPTAPSVPLLHGQGMILQRKCACGGSAGMSGECEACSQKRLGPQTTLKVNEPGDSYEQEADRIADQVTATPAHHAVSGAPPRIQRFAGQPAGQADAAPASVHQALASPGRPLEPALRHDMEQRFGHDFSQVRLHTGAAAEQSARDVNAHAYTVGHDIVFGASRFVPGTQEGRRLIAHELTHVAQSQSGAEANVVRRSDGFGEDEPTLREGQHGFVEPRGLVEKGGEKYYKNVASGEIVTEKPPGPTSGGGGGTASKAASAEAKATSAIESVTELGRIGALDAALFYLQIHAAHFAALENVSNTVEIANELLSHVTEFENGARALRGAVNQLQRAEASLPAPTEILARGVSAFSLGELEYVDAYANSARNIARKALNARVKLNEIIKGWDTVVAQSGATRDFTRKAVVEATQMLDLRFNKEKGGNFRGYLVQARDDAEHVEDRAGSKSGYANDILSAENLPLKRLTNTAASIRNELMAMAKGGGASAGVLVAIDYLKVAQEATDAAAALQAVNKSISFLDGLSGVGRVPLRLLVLKGKLQALTSD